MTTIAAYSRVSELLHKRPSSQTTIADRWNLLSDFVKLTCKGRDDSHGHAHMKAVAEMTRYIVEQDFNDESGNLMLDAITAAWLHDIADHKYDHDGTLEQRLDEFGTANIWNYEEIKHVIKYVSYSTENKAILAGTPLDFQAILGAYYSQVRDIVSDADKLEAIGKIGIHRAIEYTTEANPSFTPQQVIHDVWKHAHEKLLRLATQFIKTPLARSRATRRHKEMEEWTHANAPTPAPTSRPHMFGD
jgi:HD superfamily phosphodiesterase